MGLDAPSDDLTARIQRKRRELLQQGLVEPARPGEHPQFRGTMVPPPLPPQPSRADTRVVPLDETPERGGAAELAETSATDGVGPLSTQTEEPAQAVEVTGEALPSGSVEPLVNEWGETYDPNETGGFDLSDEYDGQQPEEFVVPAKAEVKIAPAPPKPKAKRRSAADGIVKVLAEAETIKALIGAIEFRLDNIERQLNATDDSNIIGRFDELDASLLLIAQFLSQQSKEAEAAIPVTEPEIPSFVLVRPPRGRIARFFFGD